MRLVIRAVIFSFLCIIIFGLIYRFLGEKHFKCEDIIDIEYIDYLFLATTIQSGVGYSNIYPISNQAKTILILQQIIMIMTNVFLLYIFTL